MKVTLKVIAGPAAGDHIELCTDERLQIGGSETAGFSIPGDLEISGLHFEVICTETECRIKDLNSTNGILLNGERVDEMALSDGDEIRAGQSVFSVSFTADENAEDRKPVTSETVYRPELIPEATDDDGFLASSAAEICSRVELGEAALAQLTPEHSPREFLDLLVQRELLEDALLFLAYALPKREGVWWSLNCVRGGCEGGLTEKDVAALDAAEAWVVQPTEKNRRAAMQAAEATEFESAASWPPAAAFFSFGSIGPPDGPPVPPAEELTAKVVAHANVLGVVAKEPKPRKIQKRRRAFLEFGLLVARGELSWEKNLSQDK